MKLTPDDPQLTAYALGQLQDRDRAAIEAALPEAPDCQQAVWEIQGLARQLEQALATEPCPDLTTGQKAAVLRHVPPVLHSTDESGTPGRSRGSFASGLTAWFTWPRALALGSAAVVVLVLVYSLSDGPLIPRHSINPVQQKNTSIAPGLATVPLPASLATVAPLPLKLPMPTLKGTPDDLPSGPNIEPLPVKPRPPFLAPKGVVNVARGKTATASDKNPITGQLSQITDGDREAFDDQVVEMRKGTQWVQVDLGQPYALSAIVLWHDHRWIQVYRDVVVQVADDSDFTQNVRTVFNNDLDNSSGLGIGTDKEYFETHEGRLIDANGVRARYVRSYTRGSNLSALNCLQEIEVYARPANPPTAAANPSATAPMTPEPAGASSSLAPLTLVLPMPGLK